MRGREQNLDTYTSQAEKLAGQYATVTTTSVLPGIDTAIPRLRALDVFCGSGRDAHWLATQGYHVDAMDGAHGMLQQAQKDNAHPNVTYFHDLGPEFANTRQRGNKYDFILMSAGWMHIAPERRAEALGNLLSVAKPNCTFILSLRHGPAPADRPMFEVSVKELQQLAALNLVHAEQMLMPGAKDDKLGRSNVWWEQVMLKVPHENVDQLALIKQTALQTRMSSPHKPVLMYCLAQASHAAHIISPAQAAMPLDQVMPVWQSLYGAAALPMFGRAASPASAFSVLRNGPMSHMADPATGQPLLQLERARDGSAQIILPRPLATTLQAHRDLVSAGSAAAVDRYLESRQALDMDTRTRFVSRMQPQLAAA